MPAVRATLLGAWTGTDPVSASRDLLNSLGAPHLPVLPELPARGPGSDAIGRTAALLEELAVDLQPHGWRLVPEPGMDHRRAVSALTTDSHALTDVAGESGIDVEDLLVRVSGPLTLAAELWLPGGERSLSDHGARRDVAQSLAAGLAAHVRAIRSQSGAGRLTVVLDEPRAAAVLSGALPTASGYRTVRSLPRSEVREAWTLVAQAVLDAGATGIVLAPDRAGAGEEWAWADLALLASEALLSSTQVPDEEQRTVALALPLVPLEGPGSDSSRWDIVAGWTEAGRDIVFRLPSVQTSQTSQASQSTKAVKPQPAAGNGHPYRGTGVRIARTWERIGLDPDLLGRLVLAAPDQSAATHLRANQTLASAVATAEELDRIRQDGGLG
ncbi:hypothetical protein GCM10010977_15330 [Citricoccus zhacaiensis]|uniref:Cobalamin-independent methionine synthase MetE C-terminal/archaeal domain-containing protein n=1 Tax=Citricoccus zhacaiensis TaxID=489142 RepID=A0ABQ2LY15_9MICC|nr:hypothetical protein [Citricoccus zhacaiensis]GGO44590.1 hypothetical protein GCM10010977_15330 [Citricoccus zhacaiensis]